jgi:hypothetical protein
MVVPPSPIGVGGGKSDGKGMFLAAIQEAAESSPAPTPSASPSPSVTPAPTFSKVVILNHGTVQQQPSTHTVAANSGMLLVILNQRLSFVSSAALAPARRPVH